jgi:hypothetical protein
MYRSSSWIGIVFGQHTMSSATGTRPAWHGGVVMTRELDARDVLADG